VKKQVAFTCFSLFLMWQSYGIVEGLFAIQPRHWAVTLFVAWAVNMMVTGVFAFAGFAFPTERLLPDRYYRIARPQRLQRIYRMLRVEWFWHALLTTLWRNADRRGHYFDGSPNGIAHLDMQSRKSEFGHLVPLLILTAISIGFLLDGSVRLGLMTQGFNLVGNLYPVLLQRHHRMRIQRIRALRGAIATSNTQ
jgi:hypothetical protein